MANWFPEKLVKKAIKESYSPKRGEFPECKTCLYEPRYIGETSMQAAIWCSCCVKAESRTGYYFERENKSQD